MNYDYAQVLSAMYQNQVQIFKYGKQIVGLQKYNCFKLVWTENLLYKETTRLT